MKSVFRFMIRTVLALLIFGATSTHLFASSGATISGTISDTLGAVIQNATVELVEIDTGNVVQTTNSDAKGIIPSPSPARDASASAPGRLVPARREQ